MSTQARFAEGLLSSHEFIPVITVSARGATRLKAGHLWVYRSDLAKTGDIRAGALVHVQDERGRKLGSALYSSSSQIAIRLLTSAVIGESRLLPLLRERIDGAAQFRKQFARDTDSYRVIFSEADLLPGLIVDKYNDVLSMQVVTQAFDREDLRTVVTDAMAENFPDSSLFERVDPHIRQLEQLPARESQLIQGDRSSTIFTLNGVRFHFDALGGQKTGAFLDQRENYAAAARYAHGEALDCFTYQGGFALHLARVYSKVTAVDSSRPALEVADQNEQLNRSGHICGEIEWVEANAFDLLKDYSTAGQQYDTIVLDPPAFAKTKRVLETAIRGYKELNLRALKMLRPGGVLVTCSCSFHVSEGEFLDMLGAAAADAGRRVRILEKRSAAIDHPMLSGVPETAYLKCIICQVIE
ncbi:MAG TPA: class I SAM-dependent rRNA methyltransferase [Candidatus Limnocylindrales bacterium]|nr:class I SAM-dependent rRNA methyltransferase [Candidatus Limnocylindrales bacterium]